ncbi:hypothetical protein KIN20_002686 [Parelaphostrongylus tenuis]|uniref:Protein kinase domain-containing protein n=1 Tax=Parelaphostrongylus tenuis TaxID=148309 RepID=A0AAD5QFJ2_PARTN|nr:hypothetical protein KIN20_002686 [Parelaphostrongylus tenuis]
MRKLLLILPIIHLTTSVSHVISTQGQCQAICLKEYGTLKEFNALDGSTYRDIDVMNNSDFALCKLGCGSPGFTELKLKPFERGQTAYHAITSRNTNRAPSVTSASSPPVRSVVLLCANSAENNGSVFWRIELEIRNRSSDGMIAHWVEAVRRYNSSHGTDSVVFSAWAYSSYVDFFGVVDIKNATIQFRIVSFNGSGYIGDVVKSQWFTENQLIGGNYIEMMIAEEVWRDELAAARVLFKSSQTSSCSLVLSYNSHMGIEQRMEFVMDRSRGFLLDRLAFDHPYTLRLWHVGAVTTAYSSYEFRTSTCLKMVNDPTLCAPPPVSDISWTWDTSEHEKNRVVLKWIYGSSTQMVEDGSQVELRESTVPVATTFPHMVHFDIAINPLVTVSQYQCQFLDGQRRVVTWTHRSVVVYVPNEHCNYGIEITVVDSRNRRSPTTKTQVIRYEEKYQMLLSPNGWNTGVIVLSFVVLASFLTVSAGMVACRVRDRREWNTIKRSISPWSPSFAITRTTAPVIGQADKCGNNDRCPMHPVNMVRLSFSRASDSPLNSTPILKRNSVAEKSDDDCSSKFDSHTDDAGYDTIGTPKLTDNPCETEECTGRCLPASIITPVTTLMPNTLSVPHESLRVSRRVASTSFSLWTTKHVVWPDTEQTFAIKYSRRIGHLRREFKILNHISMNHDNLVRWLGVGICGGQVLSLLFEPCNGGTLSRFLNDARRSLHNRTVIDMPSDVYQAHFLAYHLHRFALNVAQALAYLHDQYCIHLHITTENVYLALDYSDPLEIPCDQSVKVGDFCWATVPHVKCGRILSPQSLLPPEGIINGDDNTTAADVWQYGLLLAAMVTLNSAKPLLCIVPDIILTDRSIKNYYTCLSSGIRQL